MFYLRKVFKYLSLGNIIIICSFSALSAQALDYQEIDAILRKVKDTPIPAAEEGERYILQTSLGAMTIRLFPKIAPMHAANFKRLAIAGYFNHTTFHRIIKGYVIQGGDILTRDRDPANDGTGGPGYTLKNEFNDLKHHKGILAMARAGDPDSAGSQFFIMLNDAPFLDGKYTIFGEVIQGLDVLDKIGSVPVTFSSFNEKSRPIMSMELEKVIYLSQPLEKKDGGNKQESMLDKIKENSGAGKVPGDKKSAGINDARKKPVESKPKDIKK